jgi:hypothetical protein
MKHHKIIYAILFFTPSLTGAFSLFDSGNNFKTVVLEVLSVLGLAIPLLFAMAFVVFFWGLSKFILHSDSKADIDKGKDYMFWGVIALFVLVSFRAIISLISSDLGLGNSTGAPQLPTSSSGSNTGGSVPTLPSGNGG